MTKGKYGLGIPLAGETTSGEFVAVSGSALPVALFRCLNCEYIELYGASVVLKGRKTT